MFMDVEDRIDALLTNGEVAVELNRADVIELIGLYRTMKRQLGFAKKRLMIFEDALVEIKEAGSRQVWASHEREDGTYEKRVVKIDMSIEAMTAHDALTKAS